MSKSNSGYFSRTSGEGKSLIAEVEARGDKISADEVVGITELSDGRIVWLEQGHLGKNPSGLQHIVDAHGSQFVKKGVSLSDIPDLILTAVSNGKIVGYQGKGNGRPIYNVVYNGKEFNIAITIGSNGYIVGANPC